MIWSTNYLITTKKSFQRSFHFRILVSGPNFRARVEALYGFGVGDWPVKFHVVQLMNRTGWLPFGSSLSLML